MLDRLHGTDSLFRKNKAYTRHILMMTVIPAREVFPDDSKKNL